MRKIFILIVAAYITPSFADNQLIKISPINPEYRTSWAARAEYHPYGKKIMGLPISAIDREWCAANLLSLNEFPKDVQLEVKAYTEELFIVNNLESDTSSKMTASVGVAQNCNKGKPNFFILVTTPTKKDNSKVVFLEQPKGTVELVTLQKIDARNLRVTWCDACDFSSILSWKTGKFEWLPEEEMGE